MLNTNHLDKAAIARNRGVVLVVVAITSVVILIIVAFVLDLSLMAAARDQARQQSRAIALSALEQFFNTLSKVRSGNALPTTQDLNLAYRAAHDRAEQFAQQYELVHVTSNQAGVARIASVLNSARTGALLEPGVWHTDAVGCRGSACRCPAGDNPCFLPVDFSRREVPNAFRLRGDLYPDGLRATIAGKVLEIPSFPIQVSAVATLMPRHGCFLIKTSPGMVWGTHNPNPINPGDTVQKYAWYIGDTFGASMGDPLKEYWPSGDPHPQSHFQPRRVLGDFDFALDPNFAKYHPHPNSTANYGPGNHPYRMPSGTGSGMGSWYQIDVNDVPQPLGAVFTGVQTALQRFKDRRIEGDKACLIFYDATLGWARVTSLTSDFDYLLQQTNFTDPAGAERIYRMGLFPGITAGSNTPLAIQEALHQFAEDRRTAGTPTSDFIVLLGDGIVNCDTAGCGSVYDLFNRGQQAMRQLIGVSPGGGCTSGADTACAQNVPMHVVMVGEQTAPYTLAVPHANDPSQCLSEAELRKQRVAEGGDPREYIYDDPSKATDECLNSPSCMPFTPASKNAYDWALATQGFFAALRKPGTDCADHSSPCGDSAQRGSENIFVSSDGKTFRKTHPTCESETEQIQNVMKQIMGEVPYVVVQVDVK